MQSFARKWRQLRALRIFLDNASLSANPALWSAVEDHLRASRTLIYLASPEAARSPWVGREIAWWKAGDRARHLLIVVTGGTLVWDHAAGDFDWRRTDCLPREMEDMFTEEPRWVDLRWMTEEDIGSLRDPRFQECVADLAAPLHGRPKEDLIGEDVSQHRRAKLFTRGAVSVVTALAVTAGITSVVAFQQRDRARDQNRLATSRQLAATALNLSESDLRLASLLAIEAYRVQATPEAVSALNRLATSSPHLVRFVTSGKDVSELAFSPDGSTVAVGDEGGGVTVWRSDGSAVRGRTSLPSAVTALDFREDGSSLAVGDAKGALGVYDLAGKTMRRLSGAPAGVTSVAFDMAGNLAVGSEGGHVALYTGAKEKTKEVALKEAGVSSVSFWDEGARILALGANGSGVLLSVPELSTAGDSWGGVTPAGNYAAGASPSGSCFGYIKYGSTYAAGAVRPDEKKESKACGEFAWLPNKEARLFTLADAGRMAVATSTGITVVDTAGGSSGFENGGRVRELTGVGPPTLMRFSPGAGSRMASAVGRTVALWDFDQAARTAHSYGLRVPDVDNASRSLAIAAGAAGRVSWSGRGSGGPPHTWPLKEADGTLSSNDEDDGYAYAEALAYSADGKTLYVGSEKAVTVWEVSGERPVKSKTVELPVNKNSEVRVVAALAPRGDGRLAALTADGSVHAVDLATGRVRTTVQGKPPGPYDGLQGALSGDGRTSAVEGPGGDVSVYDVLSGRRLQTVPLGGEPVQNLFLSEGGGSLYVIGAKRTFARWDTGARRFRWRSDGAGAWSVKVSADGGKVVTLASDGTVTQWGAAHGDRLSSFTLPRAVESMNGMVGTGDQTGMALSPDGGTLWTVTEAGEVLSWDLSEKAWLTGLCRTAGRDLTAAEWQRYVGTGRPSRPTCS
ncbi:hypothetical protein GCM10009544_54610 [Streptomyces stramineus]|uniref:TIR domain-containing protein n=1 Tax=Streptomyces stramineus TaxID=173861 RepID=A0ABN1AY05_9ACTN